MSFVADRAINAEHVTDEMVRAWAEEAEAGYNVELLRRRGRPTKTYSASVSRDEDAWLIEVPEIARVTQALELRQVEGMARDLIAIMDDVNPSSIELHIECVPISPPHGRRDSAERSDLGRPGVPDDLLELRVPG